MKWSHGLGQKKEFIPALLLILIWTLISLLLHGEKMYFPPLGHHAWAMSDYFAMSLRFPENGFDLFHPQTYNLRTLNGITASDLPMPAWLSAIFFSVTGLEPAFSFRILSWFVSLLGLFFFFKTLIELAINPWRSLALTLFWGLLPTWVFFNHSFLPSTWAFAFFLVGFWALTVEGRHSLVNERNSSSRMFLVAIIGFTLAALLRKPFVLYLGVIVIWMFQHQRKNSRYWTIWAMGLLVFITWQFYDLYLGKVYGSGFLRKFMSPGSLDSAWALWSNSFEKWKFLWLSPAHWIWLILAILTALWRWLGNRNIRPNSVFSGYFLGMIAASVVYCFSMLKQFPDHDYYAIDAFYPTLFVGVALLAARAKPVKPVLMVEIAFLLFGLWWCSVKLDWFWDLKRLSDHGRTNLVYQGSNILLDSLNIAKNAKVLAFEAHSDNAPLIGLRRMGYCTNSSKPEVIKSAMDLPWDYAVCWDTFFVDDLINDNPFLINKLQYVGRNENILVFERLNASQNQGLEELLGGHWNKLVDSTTTGAIDAEYIFTKTIPGSEITSVLAYGSLLIDQPGEFKMTLSLFKAGENTGYADKTVIVSESQKASQKCVHIKVPNVEADELRIYIWNPQKRKIKFDDWKILYR